MRFSGGAMNGGISPHPNPLPMGEGVPSQPVERASPLPGGEGQGEGQIPPFIALAFAGPRGHSVTIADKPNTRFR